jgi:hypothetical protein
MKNEDKNFIAYEHRTITVGNDMESIWRDGYKNFGWKLEKNEPAIVKHVWGPILVMLAPLALIPGSPALKMITDHKSEAKVELKFKRSRDIPKKAELNQLQSRFESCAEEIDSLEGSKRSTATATAYLVGLIATVFMAISVFSFLAGSIQLCILAAIAGFTGWILSYFVYQSVKGSRTRRVGPLIERQYDSLYDACARASMLLHSEQPHNAAGTAGSQS